MLMERFKVLGKFSKSLWVCMLVLRRHSRERTGLVAAALT